MRFGRKLVCFIRLTLMLLCAELWLVRGFAAEGSRLVFSNLVFDNFEIYVMDADGENRENLSNHPVDDMDPDWSPDGLRIAYSADEAGFRHIFVIGADGDNRVRLTRNQGHHFLPAWSPDGQTIAYVASKNGDPLGNKIHMMTADGHFIKQVSKDDAGLDDHPDFSPVGLAVSPTSKTTTTIWGRLKTPFEN